MSDGRDKPVSHLTRAFRILTIVGSVSLALGVLIQLTQFSSFGGRRGALDGYGPVVVAQLLMVVGPVALTGAVFAYVLLAVRKDRDAEASAGGAGPDLNWYE